MRKIKICNMLSPRIKPMIPPISASISLIDNYKNDLFEIIHYSSDSRTVTKNVKKCNSPGTFSVLVVFLGVFFRKFAKSPKKNLKM